MFSLVSRIKQRAARKEASYGLYRSAIQQARLPYFYSDLAVEDSVDGRFDLLTLHVYLILRRLRGAVDSAEAAALGQDLFDLMFADMDRNLRDMGVSDLRVGKRVKAMAQAFYGRVAAYDQALDEGGGDALRTALARNVYRADEAEAPVPMAARLADYVARCESALAAQDLAGFLAGAVHFPGPWPEPGPEPGPDRP